MERINVTVYKLLIQNNISDIIMCKGLLVVNQMAALTRDLGHLPQRLRALCEEGVASPSIL